MQQRQVVMKKGRAQADADSGHGVCQRPGSVQHEGLETGSLQQDGERERQNRMKTGHSGNPGKKKRSHIQVGCTHPCCGVGVYGGAVSFLAALETD